VAILPPFLLKVIMDLYVERQCVDQMKAGDAKKFSLLFEAYFDSVYKYVARRVNDSQEAERIVRLTFLDAVGQIQNTPTDTAYLVWLYSLAKPRVWNYINKASFPKKQGLISSEAVDSDKAAEPFSDMTAQKVSNMLKKLTMEEAEILRLKFFEELADGDVLFVLGGEEALIGPKIYRVLKRAHFLLFGESDQKQGVYFGELSGFLERAKGLEKIEIPEALKLSLKADIQAKQDRKESAFESSFEAPANAPFEAPVFSEDFDGGDGKAPWEEIKSEEKVEQDKKVEHIGSNDPAKIFVQAVKEMREDQAAGKPTVLDEFEEREKILEIFDKLKWLLVLIPVLLFVIIAVVVVKGLLFDKKIQRFVAADVCVSEAVFKGGLTDEEKKDLSRDLVKEICKNFEVEKLTVDKISDGKVKINVDAKDSVLEYKLAKDGSRWLIKEYAKTSNSDKEQRKI
jgi:RNA polymerase sigma-70 factor (ECF subfamily)